jgi:hypothetical protein
MTVAALEAKALADTLERTNPTDPRFPRAFYKQVARALRVPWQSAAGGDFQWEATTGPKPFGVDWTNRYFTRVFLAAQQDPGVADTFIDVQNLIAPLSALLAPAMVRRVLRQSGRGTGARLP